MGVIHKDEENHLYYDGEVRVPSVTEILEVMGVSDYTFLSPEESAHYRKRGSFVHAAVNQIVRGKFDKRTHERFPLFSPFIRAFEDFMAETKFHPRNSEIVLYVDEWGIAGTMDLDGAFEGDDHWTEVEIKTGKKPKWALVQAAIYRAMFNYHHPEKDHIKCHRVLQLSKSGYILGRKQKDDAFHEQLGDFFTLLQAYKARNKWRENH